MFKLADLQMPILQAPMVGASTPALAAAVTAAGGLGGIAIGASSPAAIRDMIAATRAQTTGPFNVNIFVVREAVVDDAALQESVARLRPWREKLGLPPQPALPPQWTADFGAQPAVASYTFGNLTAPEVERLHNAGIFIIGTATTAEEAIAAAAVGIDAICIQGFEAGGHRGSFTPAAQLQGKPMAELLDEVLAVSRLPVIAAGGIMNGAGIAAALKKGAAAAQLGTAFLLTPEAATNAPWRTRLRAATGDETQLTRVFSGRYARGLHNAFMADMADIEARLPAYPVQNVLTGELRAAAAKAGNADCLSLWAGTGVPNIRESSAAAIMAQLVEEMRTA